MDCRFCSGIPIKNNPEVFDIHRNKMYVGSSAKSLEFHRA